MHEMCLCGALDRKRTAGHKETGKEDGEIGAIISPRFVSDLASPIKWTIPSGRIIFGLIEVKAHAAC